MFECTCDIKVTTCDDDNNNNNNFNTYRAKKV